MIHACLASDGDRLVRENVLLRQKVAEIEGLVLILRSQLKAGAPRRHLRVKERVFVLWHMEFFKIPRRRAKEYYGIACSTIYRWLTRIDHADVGGNEPANKTPTDILKLVWKIATANPTFGKLRISQQLALLGIFLSASTVRNVLNGPRPADGTEEPQAPEAQPKRESPKHIRAEHPNHVWSADLTAVRTWVFWRTDVLAVIDHFSRKLVALVPLRQPDTASIVAVLGSAFRLQGSPNHMVTDKGPVFTGADFRGFLAKHNVKARTGAVGKHGSVSITERVIESLKYEWLRRVSLIRGFDHL
ncbi:MAG: DDE-type integrase/transposase/recombinase, partial [Acidobacteriota bacterium]